VNAKGAWQGIRAKSSLQKLFLKETSSDQDSRNAMLRTELTTNVEIVNEEQFLNNGIPVTKYYNVNKDGTLPASKEAYVDFPLFRLGEIYLNYAEAVLRGGQGGDRATALNYVNNLRKRAYTNKASAPIGDAELTLNFMIDERGRELFFEAQRRTDLVRFGLFTTNTYLWPWKGGASKGKSVESYYNVFPIPSDDIGSNTNLTQNPGY
ncbi:MAG: RagB/SusD family nutrient uptake outer membrane protein, partial [Bacteroidales bacterium]